MIAVLQTKDLGADAGGLAEGDELREDFDEQDGIP